jgi:hypothetical protein
MLNNLACLRKDIRVVCHVYSQKHLARSGGVIANYLSLCHVVVLRHWWGLQTRRYKKSTQSELLAFYWNINESFVKDSTGSLIICYTSFRTINFPCFLPQSFTTLHVTAGRRLTIPPTNNTHKLPILRRLLCIIYYTSHYLYQNIINIHRIDTIYLNKRLLAHSRSTT